MCLTLRWFLKGRISEYGGNPTEVGGAYRLDRDCVPQNVYLRAKVPSSGQPIVVDINDDGVSIFGTMKPALPDDLQEHTFTTIPEDVLREGSIITLDIDQISSETAGEDLTVQLDLVEA